MPGERWSVPVNAETIKGHGGAMDVFRVSFVTANDKPDWRPLFDGYAEFYKTSITDQIADQVWDWLLDPGSCP